MNQSPEFPVDISLAANDVGIDALAAKLQDYLPEEQIQTVRDAYSLADVAHTGQTRQSGEPYVYHPLAVADILADMRMDFETLCAAILHDVIEDTEFTKEQIDEQFGTAVAELVDGVSKLTQIKFATKAIAQAENFQKMAMAMAKDVRVILIKLADRLHNIRTLGALPIEKKKRVARETLEFYSPLALRLGINSFRVEFEDRCFEAIYPMRARRIRAALENTQEDRQEILDTICQQIQSELDELNFKAEVSGRDKHLFSIYTKMKRQRKSLSDIVDVYACRLVVENEDDCYRALGVIHRLFKPISRKFKDYIAIPKANGYQSLHTVVFGMRVPIEIQIRTKEMNDTANRGIASHWLYKTSEDPNIDFAPRHLRTKKWLHGVQEMREQSVDSTEFIENFKTNLFADEVYVFTPKGDILELPNGSTAVDFAYAVHTDVGNRCMSCSINRKQASLNQVLESGQTVRIVTDKDAHPQARWLTSVVTGKARSNIRHYLNRKRHEDSISLGKRLLNKTLIAFDFPEVDNLEKLDVQYLLRELNYTNVNDILEDIGLGNRPEYLIVNLLESSKNKTSKTKSKKGKLKVNVKEAPLLITGTEGLSVSFGKCCYPLPGDKISGCAVGGRGIDVHLQQCAEFKDSVRKGKHQIDLHWSGDIEQYFTVAIILKIENKSNAVAFLASKLDQYNAQIDNIQLLEKEKDLNIIRVELKVVDRIALARLMRLLRNNKAIQSVVRQK